MKLIETKTLGTAAASIEFTSIPQDGTDLVIFTSVREATTNDGVIFLRFNGDTGNNFWGMSLQGSGSAASSFNFAGATRIDVLGQPSNYTANTFGSGHIYVTNYTASTPKSVSSETVVENNATAGFQRLGSGFWSGTSAITSLSIFPTSGNWAAGTTVSLYKITKGSSGGVTVS
jgi:hypothetical protein